jgi:protein-S-isoprenylcysteine O-methyltransferase Ste14
VLLQLARRLAVRDAERLRVGLALVAPRSGGDCLGVFPACAARTRTDPRKPTPELIVAAFRFSRNPIYVGLALIQTGVGLALGNLWILLLLAPTLWILRRGVIEKEEAYLTRKFGDAYVGYKSSVRRWL